jgi:hypothetical protein
MGPQTVKYVTLMPPPLRWYWFGWMNRIACSSGMVKPPWLFLIVFV